MITKTRVSVLAMIVLAALSITYILNVGLHVKTAATRTATMMVPDTNGLLVGSRVLLRGIEIGHVTAIRQTNTGAQLQLDYADSVRIPTQSVFRVDNLSALGEAYVAVMPDTADGPYLADNATILPQQVQVPTTFKELSEQLTTMLREVGPSQIQRIFADMDDGLPDGTEVIGDLNRAGTLLTSELTQNGDSLVTLLSTLQPLIMRTPAVPALMAAPTPQLNAFGHGLNKVFVGARDVTVIGPLLVGTRDGASPVLHELQAFLDTNSANLNTIGVNLLPAARAGAASLKTVDTGRLLDQFLTATTPQGGLTIHVPGGGR